MTTPDKRILRLIELLIFQKQISSIRDFCGEIGMFEQTITKIKNGTAHFTVLQIESICKKFNVNANWIFGAEENIFLPMKYSKQTVNKIDLKEAF